MEKSFLSFTYTRSNKKTIPKLVSGFTLIELLVVIAIIGVLSSVVISALNTARSKARDAKRLSDMNQIIKAIEMYYNDNGVYPTCSGNNDCSTTGLWGDFATMQVVPNYISGIPKDPLNILNQYGYYYERGSRPTGPNTWVGGGGDQHYLIGTRLENSSGPSSSAWGNPGLNFLRGQ